MTLKETFTKISILYALYFHKVGADKAFEILRYKSVLSILNCVYNTFINEGVPEMSTIDQSEKLRLWKLALKYQNTQLERIRAAKAAYVLSLITNE